MHSTLLDRNALEFLLNLVNNELLYVWETSTIAANFTWPLQTTPLVTKVHEKALMKKGKMVKGQPMSDLNTEFSIETLGSAIRSKRTDRGWSIDELSSKANLSRRTIMKIEKGDTSATFANVLVLMDILELSLRLIDLSLFVRPHNQISSQERFTDASHTMRGHTATP